MDALAIGSRRRDVVEGFLMLPLIVVVCCHDGLQCRYRMRVEVGVVQQKDQTRVFYPNLTTQ